MRKTISRLTVLALIISSFWGFINSTNATPYSVLKTTVWTGLVYMPDGFYVAPEAKLTILPGTIIKIGGNIGIKGSLLALGTPKEPIIFTSIREDIGEDSNKDGAKTKPAPGDWGSIEFPENCGVCTLNYVNFTYGGKGNFGMVKLSAGKGSDDRIRLSHCQISYSSSQGIWMAKSTSVIRECVITNCNNPQVGFGIWIQERSNPSIVGCQIKNCTGSIRQTLDCSPKFLGNHVSDCIQNGIQVTPGALETEVIWDSNIPYICDKFVISKTGYLRINPGAIVKNSGLISVYGKLDIRGTKDEPITFTSLNDDGFGGDTNGDGDKTQPQPGDWGGIEITGDAGDCTFTHANFLYGGGQSEKGGGYANIKFGAGGGVDNRVKLYNCVILHSQTAGLWFQASSPSIYNCVIADNSNTELGAAIWLQSRSKPTLYNCTLQNSQFAIHCDGFSYPKAQKLKVENNKFNNIYFESPLIEEDQVWGSDLVHYIPRTLGINPKILLHILPGSIIKFGSMIRVNGRLVAIGTKDKPITFTSLEDDSLGGDDNGDGPATSPVPGGNQGIQFLESDGRSVLKNCVIRYGGNGGTGNIYLGQAPNVKNSQVVESCIIEKSLGEGIKIRGGLADINGCLIRDCVNKHNGYAIRAELAAKIRVVNTKILKCQHLFDITPDVNLSTQNITTENIGEELVGGFAGIHILKGRLKESAFWDAEYPYILEDDFTIDKDATLTIEAGNVVKTNAAIYVNGALNTNGTAEMPVYITSWNDDSVAGDSNLNGKNSLPKPGDHDEIEFEGSVTNCTLKHTIIRFGGGKSRRMGSVKFGAFKGVDDRVKLINCTIEENSSAGLYMINSSPLIQDCIIKDCVSEDRGHGIYLTGSGNPKLIGVNFENCDYAIYNNITTGEIWTNNCWFGDSTGPQHPDNEGGKGYKIQGSVNFKPFLIEPNPTYGAGGKNGQLPEYRRPTPKFDSPTGEANAMVANPTYVLDNLGSTFTVTVTGGIVPYKFRSFDDSICTLETVNENVATFKIIGPEVTIIAISDSSDQLIYVWVQSTILSISQIPLSVCPSGLPIRVGMIGTFKVRSESQIRAILSPGKAARIIETEDNQVKIYAVSRGDETLTIINEKGNKVTSKIFCFADDGLDSEEPYDIHAIPGNNKVRFVWKNPNIQNTPFTGVNITLNGKRLNEVSNDVSTITVPGLENGVIYTFTIKRSGGIENKTLCKPDQLNTKIILWIDKNDAVINGKKTVVDKVKTVTPKIVNNRTTYIPFRFLAESLGAEVFWDNTKKEASFWTPTKYLQMYVNKTEGYLFGVPIKIDPYPLMIGGKVYIPLRSASEILGAKVDWEGKTKQITINYARPWFAWW